MLAAAGQVIGVNLRSSTTRDGLAAQDYAYALKVQGVGVKQIAGDKHHSFGLRGPTAHFTGYGDMPISSRQPSPKRGTIWINMASLTCKTP